MEIRSLSIPDVKLVIPKRFGDSRGFFMETWSLRTFEAQGIPDRFVQDNHSLSATVGTIRGIHYQKAPTAQAKLVRVVRGAVYDIAVDLRRGSPTFGQYVGETLSAENGHQLYVPIGFGHAFCTIEPDTEVVYKVSDYYSPADDGGYRWDDPTIGVTWPLNGAEPTISAKDATLPFLADQESPF